MSGQRPRELYHIGGLELSREHVIHRYLHLVKYVAGRISVHLPAQVELSDLINDGVLGLIDAVEKFDDSRGVKFETYAITRIHGAILDALRSLDWVPRAVRHRAREMERAHNELEIELGRAPSAEELAHKMQIPVRELHALMQRMRSTVVLSLEDNLPNEAGYEIPLVDTLKDGHADIGSEIERNELRQELIQAVEHLPPQESLVIRRYYFENCSLKDVKAELGVSESRVSQIHAQAVIRLRNRLRELRAELGYNEGTPVRQKYIRKS